jgi:hypothetical protein
VAVVLQPRLVDAQRSDHQLRILPLPLGEPGGQVPVGLLQVAPVVDPAQFLQAVLVGVAGQVIEGALRRKCP